MEQRSNTRHGKIAPDSVRQCTIFPKATMEQIKSAINPSRPDISSVIREFVAKGLSKEFPVCQSQN